MAFSNRSFSFRLLKQVTLVAVVKNPSPGHISVKLGRMEAKKRLVFSIPLDLNQATMEDLCLISGVGESLAGRSLPTGKGEERSDRLMS